MTLRSVCVFCGSRTGDDPAYADAAATLGRLAAARGLTLVYGGGRVGLMGVAADAAIAAGGRVTGIIPGFLKRREVAHAGVALEVVDSMHTRKARMFDLSDAFLVLPGGIGTLDETMEIVTWRQLGHHDKPVVLVDVKGYWRPLTALLDHVVTQGFAGPSLNDLYVVAADPAAALDLAAQAPKRHPGTSAGL
ncbi:MAG: TIGR00730 family Rossman fold protein [Alphaproteobacteria bacterium]